jgi:hypothetical protein
MNRLDFSTTLSDGIELLKKAMVPYSIVSVMTGLAMGIAVFVLSLIIVGPIIAAIGIDGSGTVSAGAIVGLMVTVLLTVIVIGAVAVVISAAGIMAVTTVFDETAQTGASSLESGINGAKAKTGPMLKTIFVMYGLYLLAMIPMIIPILNFLYVLVFVPAVIYFGISWSLVGMVVYTEGTTGMDALRRSRELVSPNWWTMFGVIFVVAAITFFTNLILGFTIGQIPVLGQIITLAIAMVLGFSAVAFQYVAYKTLTTPGMSGAPGMPPAGYQQGMPAAPPAAYPAAAAPAYPQQQMQQPPMQAPPVQQPPMQAPPVQQPPAQAPPMEQPPAQAAPPVEQPPAAAPDPAQAPGYQPPAYQPPAQGAPPAYQPPAANPTPPPADGDLPSAPGSDLPGPPA